MKELVIENLHKTYGIKTLLGGVNFSIRTGDRIGLIGANGTGKSSFLKVIAGKDSYDQGHISAPNQYSIAYLSQQNELNPHQTILQTIYQSEDESIQLVLAYAQAVEALTEAPNNDTIVQQFNRLSDQMTQLNAWDIEVRAKTILSKLGIHDLHRKVQGCSGGEQKRIALAQVLISQPDLLILDEPTNHLDMDSIQWLEKYLGQYQGALLLVTHDRYFLDRSVNKIVELKHGQLHEYRGTYQDYLIKRSEEAQIQEKMMDKQDKLFQQELAWMRKGAKARTTKQQARIDRFSELKANIQDRPQEAEDIHFNFDQQRIGNRIIDLEHVDISIAGKSVVHDLSKIFIKGDRLGIIGENGVGKSTLLNTIVGTHPVDAGSIELGQTVNLAYYRQMDEDLPGDMRVLNYLTQVADTFKREGGREVSASQMLERFNFPRESHGTYIHQLSGGERRRLYLLTLLIQEPNVLILDEPTNDLDIDTLTVLEDYLEEFQGVVLTVSHDRYFLDKTMDQLLVLQGQGQFEWYYGSFSEFLDQKGSNSIKDSSIIVSPAEKIVAETPTTSINPKDERQRMTYHEKKEWATIEEDIFAMEMHIEEIQAHMLQHANDAGILMDDQKDLEASQAQLDHLYERYDYLSDLKE